MRTTRFALAWLFIFTVAAYDVSFAWRYRAVFQVWEMNPLARRIAQDYGLAMVFILKMILLGFALTVAAYCHRRRHRLELPYTLVLFAVHLLLSLHYLLGEFPSI